MTPGQMRRLRLQKCVSFLDIAAYTGLPANYIQQIEEEAVVALDSDLKRIEKAITQAAKELADDDDQGDVKYG